MRKYFTFLCLLLTLGGYAKSEKLRFIRYYKLASEGVMFKIPKEWSAQPLPALQTHSYTRTHSDGTQEKIQMFDPADIWLRSQHLSMISGKSDDTRIMFAKMRSLPPSFSQKHVKKEVYDKAVANASLEVSWDDVEGQKKWLTAYTGTEYELTDNSHKLPLRGVKCRAFKGNDLYALTFYVSSRKSVYCLYWDLPDGISSRDLSKHIRSISAGIKLFKPQKSISLASRMQDRKMNGGKSPEFLASKQKVISDIKNLDNWWYVETPNYIICSDMPSKQRRLAMKVQQNIEKYRAAYEKIMPPWDDIRAVSVVKIFARRDDYINYVGEELRWSGGVWMPSKQELVVSPPGWEGARKRQTEESVLSTLYHEAFHQYLFYSCNKNYNAVWFNEGHATFFENAEMKSGMLVASEDPYEFRNITAAINGGRASIKKMLSMPYAAFYQEDVRKDSYSVSWGMVYYLQKHCEYKKNQYKDVLSKYKIELKKSKDWLKASNKAFEGIDMDNFQKDFEEFWLEKKDRRKAERARIFRKLK